MFDIQKLREIAKPDTEWLPAAEYRKKHGNELRLKAENKLKQLIKKRLVKCG